MNLENAYKSFQEYVKGYDIEDEKIRLKVVHTFHVSRICKEIAISLHLDKQQQELAELIGLLHDIGRFEQLRKYQTFSDAQSENHALLGIQQLQKDNFIRNFIEESTYDELIYTAIRSHNRFEIESHLDDTTLLFVKMIRDADKIDIFRVDCEERCEVLFLCTIEELQRDEITPAIYQEMMMEKTILASQRRTKLDVYLSHLALVYDINFKESIRILKEKRDYQKLLTRYLFENKQTQEQFESIVHHIQAYIEKKGCD